MRIDILTLFPEMFDVFDHSIIKRAKDSQQLQINAINIRDYSENKHRKTDDYPYGGGAGMVMTPQPIVDCLMSVKETNQGKVVFLGPRGKTFDHEMAKKLSNEESLIFLCGHYEGIDERVRRHIDIEVSLGDFILTGGEMACIPIVDSISRLIPGVLGSEESFMDESFCNGLLEYPQYTRPYDFRGDKVPDMLLSGHHENIENWRKLKSLELTKENREDLYKQYEFTKNDKKILKNKDKYLKD